MINVIRPRLVTAGTVQSNSIKAKDPAMTADTGWRVLGH